MRPTTSIALLTFLLSVGQTDVDAKERATRVPVKTRVARVLGKAGVREGLVRGAFFLAGLGAAAHGVVNLDMPTLMLGGNVMIAATARTEMLPGSVAYTAGSTGLALLGTLPPPDPMLDVAVPFLLTLAHGTQVSAENALPR